MRTKFVVILILFAFQLSVAHANRDSVFNFVFVSDSHYGLVKDTFRGKKSVSSSVVNQAMINAINYLPELNFPQDNGVSAGEKVEYIEFVVNGGDISNRMQSGVQSATKSWESFYEDYYHGLRVYKNPETRADFYLIPGNHDVSNAIGYTKPMEPLKDARVMVEIYNRMMPSLPPVSEVHYNYNESRVRYSFSVYGLHFQFINMWPDSLERIWMKADLDALEQPMPVVLFTHDEPDIEPKHFTNPVAPHDINNIHKFENLLAQHYSGDLNNRNTVNAQNEMALFFKEYDSFYKAYFHGNYNWNDFYQYNGPSNNIDLSVFRVDSPMKGEFSSKDERLLSFIVASVDMKTRRMTVRECFYNQPDATGSYVVKFGMVKTVGL